MIAATDYRTAGEPFRIVACVVARGVPAGDVRVDVAYGGAIYAFVAAAQLGLELTPHALAQLVAAGRAVKAALAGSPVAVHPDDPRLSGIYGTVIHEQLGPGHHRTGEHQFVLDPRDELGAGFVLR